MVKVQLAGRCCCTPFCHPILSPTNHSNIYINNTPYHIITPYQKENCINTRVSILDWDSRTYIKYCWLAGRCCFTPFWHPILSPPGNVWRVPLCSATHFGKLFVSCRKWRSFCIWWEIYEVITTWIQTVMRWEIYASVWNLKHNHLSQYAIMNVYHHQWIGSSMHVYATCMWYVACNIHTTCQDVTGALGARTFMTVLMSTRSFADSIELGAI